MTEQSSPPLATVLKAATLQLAGAELDCAVVEWEGKPTRVLSKRKFQPAIGP